MTATETILDKSELFSGLPDAERARLSKQMRTSPVKKGQVIFDRGEKANGCYAVLEGAFKVAIISEDGEETLLAMLGEGDIVGEMGLLDGEPRSATVIALRRSRVAHLSTRDFERVADENPNIYRHLLKLLSNRMRAVNETFAARQMLPLAGRLARTLLRLSEEFGQELDGDRMLIRQKVTQADLARMTGSARENVNRQIKEWQRNEVLSKISQYYCLDNISELKKLGRI